MFNTTTIESWEIERHETLVRRARVLGGHLDGPGGVRIRIKKQEFPYDIGIFANVRQGMGGSINVSLSYFSLSYSRTGTNELTSSQFISWLWPFASTPDRKTGWEFETNGFEGMPRLSSTTQ